VKDNGLEIKVEVISVEGFLGWLDESGLLIDSVDCLALNSEVAVRVRMVGDLND
jgi:hypothetical protein